MLLRTMLLLTMLLLTMALRVEQVGNTLPLPLFLTLTLTLTLTPTLTLASSQGSHLCQRRCRRSQSRGCTARYRRPRRGAAASPG